MKLDNEFFWNLTPFEFYLLAERYKETEKMLDYRQGIVATLLANSNRDPKKRKKPYVPSDFFPSLSHKKKVAKSPEQLYKMAEVITKVLG